MIRLTNEKLRNTGTQVSYDGLSFEQRLLLINSGSMTFLLEEFLNQELILDKLYEAIVEHKEESHLAPYLLGQRVLKRKIALKSAKTHVNHLYAESFILIDNLDPAFADLLLNSNIPIGKLWEAERIETYKVLETWGGETQSKDAMHFGLEARDPLIFRTYFVFTGKKLTMKITEKFPEAWYKNSMLKGKSYKTVA